MINDTKSCKSISELSSACSRLKSNTAMTNQEALIALNMIEGIGPIRARHLIDSLGDAAAILNASRGRLMGVNGIGEDTANSIANWEQSVDLSGELRRIHDFGCHVLTGEDPAYPKWLREIYDPPLVLYVRGNLTQQDTNSVAIVGSRITTHYGTETARKLAYQLAYVGVTVVSGGARGIDTAAHQGALSGKGRTIAVLGTGINLVVPPENAGLLDRIAENGAVISQFPFNRKADRQSFPIRNRIVAGMTLGTVVVEAARRSGALITSNFAVDYGRQVFAVPGRIDSPRSKGCHELIKNGAKLCENTEDILSEFEYLFPPGNRGAASVADSAPPPALTLPENELKVYETLGDEEWNIDAIIHASGLPPATVSVALLGLEMKKWVRQLPGKIFIRNERV
jgi:DNA processing protein